MAKTRLHILMLTEYFYPHARGGSEWSTYYLSQSLVKKGHKISILTPNYGTRNFEVKDKLHIYRFNIIKKLQYITDEPTNPQTTASPFWHTNLFWFFQTLRAIFRIVKQENIDIIHIQGKYFLPAAIIVGKITQKPVILTARDYQVICNLSFCLWKSKKSCNLKDYFFKDFIFYKKTYMNNPSLARIFLQLLFLTRARWTTKILHFFAQRTQAVICTSNAPKQIYLANGIKATSIYNTVQFPEKPARTKHKKQIIFAGRLTPGKGADLLIPTFMKLKINGYKLLIVGEGILKPDLEKQIQLARLDLSVRLLGGISHTQLLQLYRESSLSLTPSVWPENFGRAPLESIAQGTPVVTSNRGGLPEIVQNKYGLSVKPTASSLAQAINRVLKHRQKYVKSIKQDRKKLIYQFNQRPADQYETLYYRCLS